MDKISAAERSRIMSRIRGKDTAPEMLLRKALSRLGYRYRMDYGKYRIDIAFVSNKIAVFVDGCFWHGCKIHSKPPKTNRSYWIPKLHRNMQRDMERTADLEGLGWIVLRFWEHDIEQHLNRCVTKVERTYNGMNE